MTPIPKNTICLWFDRDAEAAARFYASVFPDSRVTAIHRAPGDYPSGTQGDVLTVEFTVLGIPCLGLNGGLRLIRFGGHVPKGGYDVPNGQN